MVPIFEGSHLVAIFFVVLIGGSFPGALIETKSMGVVFEEDGIHFNRS